MAKYASVLFKSLFATLRQCKFLVLRSVKGSGNGVQCSLHHRLSDNKSDNLVDDPTESPDEPGYGWSGSLDSDPPLKLSHSQLAGGGRPGGRTLAAPPFTPPHLPSIIKHPDGLPHLAINFVGIFHLLLAKTSKS